MSDTQKGPFVALYLIIFSAVLIAQNIHGQSIKFESFERAWLSLVKLCIMLSVYFFLHVASSFDVFRQFAQVYLSCGYMVKFSIFALLFVLVPIPDFVIPIYMNVSIIGAALFALVQLMCIVDFGYRWNHKWVKKERYALILLCCATLFAHAIYILYNHVYLVESCKSQVMQLAAHVVLLAVSLAMSFTVDQGNLLTTSVVFWFASMTLVGAWIEQPCAVNTASHSWTMKLFFPIASTTMSMWFLTCYAHKIFKVFFPKDDAMHDLSTDSFQDFALFCFLFLGTFQMALHLEAVALFADMSYYSKLGSWLGAYILYMLTLQRSHADNGEIA